LDEPGRTTYHVLMPRTLPDEDFRARRVELERSEDSALSILFVVYVLAAESRCLDRAPFIRFPVASSQPVSGE
jgi:hypothetical protein